MNILKSFDSNQREHLPRFQVAEIKIISIWPQKCEHHDDMIIKSSQKRASERASCSLYKNRFSMMSANGRGCGRYQRCEIISEILIAEVKESSYDYFHLIN